MAPRTQTVGDLHSYTRSELPWSMREPDRGLSVTTSGGAVHGWRLFRYLGRGTAGFGLSARQELVRLRRKRFLRIAAAAAILWMLSIWL